MARKNPQNNNVPAAAGRRDGGEDEREKEEEETAAAVEEEEAVVHGVSSIGRKNVGACAAFSMRTREPDLHARQLPSIEFIRAKPSVSTQEACI